MKYNIIAKRLKGKEFIILDMIATNLNKKDYEKIKSLNQNLLSEYDFIPYSETDFSWWCKIDKFLTRKKLQKQVYFECDFNGDIKKY